MTRGTTLNNSFLRRQTDAGDAVGVQRRHWYVAIVNNNTEKSCGSKISKMGYDAYVPMQREAREFRPGRRKTVDRVVIPSRVFVHCTERERLKEIVTLPYIKRFMVDRALAANGFGSHPVAIVPDSEIEKLRFILVNSDNAVTIESRPLRLGDKVRVTRGKLMGLEGNILRRNDGETDLLVQLNILGCARVAVSRDDLERVV